MRACTLRQCCCIRSFGNPSPYQDQRSVAPSDILALPLSIGIPYDPHNLHRLNNWLPRMFLLVIS